MADLQQVDNEKAKKDLETSASRSMGCGFVLIPVALLMLMTSTELPFDGLLFYIFTVTAIGLLPLSFIVSGIVAKESLNQNRVAQARKILLIPMFYIGAFVILSVLLEVIMTLSPPDPNGVYSVPNNYRGADRFSVP